MRLLDDVDRLLDAGRPAVAELLLNAIDRAGVDGYRITACRARCALALNEPMKAVRLLDLGIASGLQSASLFLWRARAWLAAGDADRACDDAGAAAAAAPLEADAVGLFTTLLIEKGQPLKAARVLEAAILSRIPGSMVYVVLTVALLAAGQREPAWDAMMRGLARDPLNVDLQHLRKLHFHADQGVA